MSKKSMLVVPTSEGSDPRLGIGGSRAIIIACGLLTFIIPGFAGNITVINPSFEDPPPPGTACISPYLTGCLYNQFVAPNGWSVPSGRITVGWGTPGPLGTVFPPYPFATYDAGINNAFVNGFSGPMIQTVSATTVAGGVYSLSVDMAWRLDNPDFFSATNLVIGPYATGVRIALTGVRPVQGYWSTFTARYTATTSGLPITIELVNTSTDPLNPLKNGQADFDNVSLSLVPEPGTIAMTAIGMGILALGLRRKQSA